MPPSKPLEPLSPIGQGKGTRLGFEQLKRQFHQLLVKNVDVTLLRKLDDGAVRRELKNAIEDLCLVHAEAIGPAEKERLIRELMDEMLGFGPLESPLRDPAISDILINGPQQVYVERNGQLQKSPISFASHEQLLHVIQRIAARAGRRIDEASPMVDAALPDGSRFNAVIAPLALDGALVSIRRFTKHGLNAEELIRQGCISEAMMTFLAAAVRARMNMIVSGGTGSGKTTLLNLLSSFISPLERIITIEDAAELRLQQPHVARMETRPANIEGVGCITTRQLVRNALRMRPDRIIVGECRGEEAFDMLQAMNTGHDGSLTTIHSNSAGDAVTRLQMLLGTAGSDLPMWYIDRQIASAVQLIVHVNRLAGGVRRVTEIVEISGYDGKQVTLTPIFSFRESSGDAAGSATGRFLAHGNIPRVAEKLAARGIHLPQSMFQITT